MIRVHQSTLPNKLRIVTVPLKSTDAVTVLILVRAGSRCETRSINGIAHFLEHMFFKGAQRYPDTKAVAEALDGVGGLFNAFTADEFVGYYVKLAKDKVNLAFDVLSDMLLNSKFAQAEIDRERQVILEEYNMYEDTPIQKISDVFQELIYGDQPVGWPTIGRKEVIRRLKRRDFLRYKDGLYTPDSIVVAVAGNITPARVRTLVRKYLPYSQVRVNHKFKSAKAPTSRNRLRIQHKKTEQAHFAVGVPAISGKSQDKYAAKLLAAILGGSMSSRLWLAVRERQGLGYYIRTDVPMFVDTGYLVTYAGVDLRRIRVAIKIVLEEYQRIAQELVSIPELTKAKELIKGRTTLGLEDSEAVASSMGLQELLYRQVETPKQMFAKIDRVTPQAIQKLAKKILQPDKTHLAVIGPYKNEHVFNSLLQ